MGMRALEVLDAAAWPDSRPPGGEGFMVFCWIEVLGLRVLVGFRVWGLESGGLGRRI